MTDLSAYVKKALKKTKGENASVKKNCGPLCKLGCPWGNVLDPKGCPICKCKKKPKCGPVCEIHCQYGNVLDNKGCPTCKCREPPKCGPVCQIFCRYGNIMDDEGCPTCNCRTRKDAMLSAWEDFFDATGGTEWKRCKKSRSDPCQCRRVTCSNEESDEMEINTIKLKNMNLKAESYPSDEIQALLNFGTISEMNIQRNPGLRYNKKRCENILVPPSMSMESFSVDPKLCIPCSWKEQEPHCFSLSSPGDCEASVEYDCVYCDYGEKKKGGCVPLLREASTTCKRHKMKNFISRCL